MAAPLAVAGTVSTDDTVVEEGTVLEKRAPDLTFDCTAASRKDPAWGHPDFCTLKMTFAGGNPKHLSYFPKSY